MLAWSTETKGELMAEAYIVEALRTAGGRRGGALREWHPADLGAAVLDALVSRSGIDPAAIEDVIVGCVSQVGEQSFHIGRNMVMASDLPDSVPAVSIDRQCGSSQQALHFAAQAVMSGTQDVVIAAGRRKHDPGADGNAGDPADAGRDRHRALAAVDQGPLRGRPVQPVHRRRDDGANLWLRRARSSTRSPWPAIARRPAAADSGAFEREIVVVDGLDKEGNARRHDRDEGIRADASLEGLAELKTDRRRTA